MCPIGIRVGNGRFQPSEEPWANFFALVSNVSTRRPLEYPVGFPSGRWELHQGRKRGSAIRRYDSSEASLMVEIFGILHPRLYEPDRIHDYTIGIESSIEVHLLRKCKPGPE